MATKLATNIGERLLPSLVDEIAKSEPSRVFYSVAKTKDPADGFQDIDAETLAKAVDRCSWYIEKTLGRGHDFPTLTYMGPQDVVYAILILACIKTGYKLLLNSPRNTLEAHLSLFEETHCNTFLLPPRFPLPIVGKILEARPMRVVEIFDMKHWVEGGPEEPYPYSKTYAEAKSEPFVVLHTSGSTGVPKPVVQTHGTLSPLDAFTPLPSQGLQPTYPAMCAGFRVYLAFPLFHCAGVSMLLPASIYAGFTIVLGPFPPSADIANSVHVYGNVQHSCIAPATLVDLAKNPEHLENLGRLKQVTYGGGPCPQAVGDLISSKTTLLNVLGTTECGVLPIQLCGRQNWAYMSVSPVLGHYYRQVSEDLYEQVIVRNPKLSPYQGVFETFPQLNEWPMKDLYSKHPTEDNMWLYRGRVDDIIVFSTGEKLNPIDMEGVIAANPAISAALVTGFGRFQSSLLVEPTTMLTNDKEKKEFLDVIWSSVQAANRGSPSYGQIHRNMIIYTSAEKPMLRAGKGTVQRKLTVDLYADELDSLYKANEHQGLSSSNGPNNANGNTNGHTSVQDTVKRVIALATEIDVGNVDDDAELFELGLDSLQVTVIARHLNEFLAVHSNSRPLEVWTVYANPSVGALTTAVVALSEGKTVVKTKERDEDKMKKLYDLHVANLPLSTTQEQHKRPESFVFLLTGSTGSLGSYVLDSLQRNESVSRVYCLNRGQRSLERQQKSQATKGLQPVSQKVTCLDADLSKPYFGLSLEEHKKLLGEVTNIVHNAWRVDFNLSIDSFASHIRIARQFVDFSAQSNFNAQLFFMSSIGAISQKPGEVPEKIFEDWDVPQPIGYGQSKFVVERLLDTAVKQAGIAATICRVGQVAGPTTAAGIWPKQEWLPSLIASSKYLGKLPATLGQMEMVDWVPVDVLSESIIEMAIKSAGKQTNGATVFHAVNPQRTTWSKLLPTVNKCLEGLETVPLDLWVDAVRQSSPKGTSERRNPATKILGFYESLVRDSANPILLDTRNTIGVSHTLASLGPVQDKWMENWITQWAF
ncbi:Fc.00g043140.m01.CDS01 [Cosmosporella sp. VM-42]